MTLYVCLSGWVMGVSEAETLDLDLDNGIVRVGVETDTYGGAITYLSLSGQTRNLINNFDRGRQVQQSYYAGDPIDRRAAGQHAAWSPWPWNPIQVGDAYGNSATVLEAVDSGTELYVKTRPLLWDMNNETAQCTFETWITLDRTTVHVRNRVTTFRTDNLWQVSLRHQELPAVYTIADLNNLYTYNGPAPFSNAPATKVVNNGPPWVHWGTSGTIEKWAASVDNSGWGVGVYNAETELFTGGFHGAPGGGEFSASTGYISPLRTIAFGKNTVFEFEYDLVVGTLEQIRAFVYNANGLHDYDQDGLTYEQETRDLDPALAGMQNPFDPGVADSTGDNGVNEPDGIPDGANDYDGDGIDNFTEFSQGLDPVVPNGPPTLPLRAAPTVLCVLILLYGIAKSRKSRNGTTHA